MKKALLRVSLLVFCCVAGLSAAPLLRAPIEEFTEYCAPALSRTPPPKVKRSWLVAKLSTQQLNRSLALVDASRGAAGYHARRGLNEKAEEYRKLAITQLKNIESQLVALEGSRAFEDIGIDVGKVKQHLGYIRRDIASYNALLESGKFPDDKPNQPPEPTASGRGSP